MRQCKALAVVFAPAFAISGASSAQDFMAEPGAFLVYTRVGIVDAFALTAEHGPPPSVLQCELQPSGYCEVSLDRLEGSNAYRAIFAPPSIASRMRPEAMVPCKTSRAI
jgi:hypothetical protein